MTKINKKHFIFLLIILYVTMILFGGVENIKGVSFPLIRDTFNTHYDAQGGLVSSSWFGYVLFCMVATICIEKFGTKTSLLLGYMMTTLGCILILFAPSFTLVSMALMIIWMGFGFFEVGANALSTTTFTSNSAIYMNLMHFFYGVGAIGGPLFATGVVKAFNVGFRGIYLITLIPLLLMVAFIFFTPFKKDKTEEQDKPQMTITQALKNHYVWLFAIALGFMEVIEFGVANWGAFFLKDAYGLDPLTVGAWFVSSYYVFFTLSRLFSGFAIEKIGYVRSLVIGLMALFVLYILGFTLGTKGIIFLSLTGFFVGILWPTVMCFAMQVFGKDVAIASSVIIVLSGTVNGIVQLLTGFVNEYILNTLGYKLNTLYLFIPILLILYIHKKLSTSSAEPIDVLK